jgi:CRP-like cAMP-binding protein
MAGKTSERSASKNRILAASAGSEGKLWLQRLQPIVLTDKQILYEQGDSIKYVYFPLTAVISLVGIMEDGSSIELATTGHEGLVGIGAFFGIDKMFAKAIVQVPGEAMRMRADVFKAGTDRLRHVNAVMARFSHALLVQVTRSGGCNSLHTAEQRFARWLLTMDDRTKADEMPFTHEFLGEMLGVRRPSVSQIATKLQKAGAIRYKRGRVKILDRLILEKASCECYRVLKEEYEGLLR